MDSPKVTIVELPRLSANRRRREAVDLGDGHSLEEAMVEGNVQSIINRLKARSRRVFEMTWKGSKTPSGAIILGKKVAWTQNGRVTGEGGEYIGTYERLETSEGLDSQKMRTCVAARDEHSDKN